MPLASQRVELALIDWRRRRDVAARRIADEMVAGDWVPVGMLKDYEHALERIENLENALRASTSNGAGDTTTDRQTRVRT